jgi:hypothetical protein
MSTSNKQISSEFSQNLNLLIKKSWRGIGNLGLKLEDSCFEAFVEILMRQDLVSQILLQQRQQSSKLQFSQSEIAVSNKRIACG